MTFRQALLSLEMPGGFGFLISASTMPLMMAMSLFCTCQASLSTSARFAAATARAGGQDAAPLSARISANPLQYCSNGLIFLF
jgi:hypothetical protein